jgi:D-beta-D-heptose 7-phosphate kinase/D-beta-D-heptose 1-phosphate adenosyltransferase
MNNGKCGSDNCKCLSNRVHADSRKRVVLVTGGFDPLHRGHVAYFQAANAIGDVLIVGLNSNEWLERKKGTKFMDIEDRLAIVDALKYVDGVIVFDDADNTAIDAIMTCLEEFPEDTIVFANGGDRTLDNIPEMVVESDRVIFTFGVGGEDKKNSSSWILNEYKERVTNGKDKENTGAEG